MSKQSFLVDRIVQQCAERDDTPAVLCAGVSHSYRSLALRARRFANVLNSADQIKARPRIAYFGKVSSEYYELLLTALITGGVFVPVNWRLAPMEAVDIIRDAEVDVIVIEPDFLEIADSLLASDVKGATLFLTGGGVREGGAGYESSIANSSEEFDIVKTDEDAAVLQLYTSGTTGVPKGVQLSHSGLLAQFELFNNLPLVGRITPDDVLFVCLPGFHVVGAAYMLQGLFRGAQAVIQRDFDPVSACKLIDEHKVTHTVFVPTIIAMIIQTAQQSNADLSSLRALFYGTSPISEELLKAVPSVLSCSLFQAYGLTEAGGLVTVLPPEDHSPQAGNRLKSAGFAGAGVEVRVVDPSGEVCATEQSGEIIIRSPTLMSGYWKKPEETAAVIKDGWFHTGDIGFLDEDGYVFLRDRLKDMIITGGENVYPAELERVLMTCPGVADVAVVGVPDEKWGEAVLAVIIRSADSNLNADDIRAYTRERLAGYKVPKHVEFRNDLPRNHMGKVLKREVREPYWKGQSRQVS
ncbi:MAG: long-chain-fatty-acid--CoA ligase [Pseudomonadota bacterium]